MTRRFRPLAVMVLAAAGLPGGLVAQVAGMPVRNAGIGTGIAMASRYERWDDPVLHAKLAVFPPLVMGVVKSATGGYALGFILMALVALGCLAVLQTVRSPRQTAAPAPAGR